MKRRRLPVKLDCSLIRTAAHLSDGDEEEDMVWIVWIAVYGI